MSVGGHPTKTAGGSTLSYDDAGQVATKTTGGVPTSFGYDTRGNRTSEGATRTYAYDQANRMKAVTTSGTTSTYAYDGDGMRSSKTTGGSTKSFVYDQAEGLPLVLSDATNTYLYGPNGSPVEQVDGANNATYLHADQLGSTRVLTDQSRATVGTYSYDAYGKETAHTGSSTPLRYAGQYADDESGLYWMRARYYDPTTAQFINRDPIEAVTRSPYGYVNGDPLNGTDPSGLMCLSAKCLLNDVKETATYAQAAIDVAAVVMLVTPAAPAVPFMLAVSGGLGLVATTAACTQFVTYGQSGSDCALGAATFGMGSGVSLAVRRSDEIVRIAARLTGGLVGDTLGFGLKRHQKKGDPRSCDSPSLGNRFVPSSGSMSFPIIPRAK